MSQPSGNMGSSGSKDDRTLGMLAHVLGLLTCIVGPLVIWLLKKDSSAFVGDNAKEALNFQITMAIGWVASTIVFCIPFVNFVAFLFWVVLGILDLVFCIMGAMAANKGELYRYPFAIRLIN
jgi:uncharacterized Tic20 family protein